jgi:hypothetical protein
LASPFDSDDSLLDSSLPSLLDSPSDLLDDSVAEEDSSLLDEPSLDDASEDSAFSDDSLEDPLVDLDYALPDDSEPSELAEPDASADFASDYLLDASADPELEEAEPLTSALRAAVVSVTPSLSLLTSSLAPGISLTLSAISLRSTSWACMVRFRWCVRSADATEATSRIAINKIAPLILLKIRWDINYIQC